MRILLRNGRLRAGRVVPRTLGITLLEIMIVLAIIAVVMGIVIGPKVIDMWNGSKVKTTRMRVHQLVFSSYVSWAVATGKRCPPSLETIAEHDGRKNTKDAWGNELIMLCGEDAPPEAASGFAVLSLGPDGKRDTDDDLRSWDE